MKLPRGRRLTAWLLGAVAVLYLGGVNLILNTGIGPALVNLRPRATRLSWRAAWTLWPGHLQVRGLQVRGERRSRAWLVSIERASARWSPTQLFARQLRFSRIRAEGVAAQVRRVPYTPPPGAHESAPPASA